MLSARGRAVQEGDSERSLLGSNAWRVNFMDNVYLIIDYISSAVLWLSSSPDLNPGLSNPGNKPANRGGMEGVHCKVQNLLGCLGISELQRPRVLAVSSLISPDLPAAQWGWLPMWLVPLISQTGHTPPSPQVNRLYFPASL